jgi:hypothetical protein
MFDDSYQKPKLLNPVHQDNLPFEDFDGPKGIRWQALLQDLEFFEVNNFRRQRHIACNALRPSQHGARFTFEEIGHFLGAAIASRIERESATSLEEIREPGRPKSISDDLLRHIEQMIESRFRERRPVTYGEFLDYFQ